MRNLNCPAGNAVQVYMISKERGDITVGWSSLELLGAGRKEGDLLIIEDINGRCHGVDPEQGRKILAHWKQ